MSYNVEDIKTLDYPVSVQRRLGMYLGSKAKNPTSPGQKNVAVREITDNSVTEVVKGYGDKVEIIFEKDGTIIVRDNGRGIPTGIDKETGVNGIEKCVAELHSGGNFFNDGKSGPGLNGVGGSAVNAVSSFFKVEVLKKKNVFTEVFSNGLVEEKMKKEKFDEKWFVDNTPTDTGTCITFKLNGDFFSDVDNVIAEDIIDRMRYTVYVVPNLKIDIYDRTGEEEEEYHFFNDGGIEGLLEFVNHQKGLFTSKGSKYTENGIFKIETTANYKEKVTRLVDGESKVKVVDNKIPIEVSFKFTDGDKDIKSFANTIQTKQGGVHEQALCDALVEVFGKLASSDR